MAEIAEVIAVGNDTSAGLTGMCNAGVLGIADPRDMLRSYLWGRVHSGASLILKSV